MIDTLVVQEVLRLLRENRLSQRQIARAVGINRGTVGAIALGRRRDHGPNVPETAPFDATQPPVRCTVCGGMVYLPCRLCYIRAWQRHPKRQQPRPAWRPYALFPGKEEAA